MFEVESYEEILDRLLSRIPSSFDKREGSVIWLALAPAAAEIVQLQIDSQSRLNESFADTSSYEYLRRRAEERGVHPFEPTNAILKAEFNQDVPLGSMFAKEELTYTVVEKLEDDFEYKIICNQKGTKGNNYFGTIIPLEYIDGLTEAEITEILIPARDLEYIEDFRQRYYDSFKSEAFGGNIQDYKEKTLSIEGVGAVRIIPVWAGGGTVKVIILDGELNKPSNLLISNVQNELDPVGHQGLGYGLAPIGHVVTVEGVNELLINVKSDIILDVGKSWENVKPLIEDELNTYIFNLKQTWKDGDIIVRIAQIESIILNIDGVLDVSNTEINDDIVNISLSIDEIPELGDVTNG